MVSRGFAAPSTQAQTPGDAGSPRVATVCEYTHPHTEPGTMMSHSKIVTKMKERHKYHLSVSACSRDDHKNTTAFSYDDMTHLAAFTETASFPQAITEGPQSPFSLVQFKKLGEEAGVSQVGKGRRSSHTNCSVPLAVHLARPRRPQPQASWVRMG